MEGQTKYIYQQYNSYFATVCDGVEDLLKKELVELGAKKARTVYRGVNFNASQAELYKINYTSSLATRIYAPLISFDCHSTKYLYNTGIKIWWEDFLTLSKTFAINSTVSHSAIKHSKYAALCLKDAIVDTFRERHGERPSVDSDNPDVWFNLHIQENKALISVDTSGGSLHRRGYRAASVEAPMQESVAAAIIKMSEWDGSQPLYDPMCGSGTLLAEAYLAFTRLPPAFRRDKFGFERLPDFNPKQWEQETQAAHKRIRRAPEGLISGSDIDIKAVQATQLNFKQVPGSDSVSIKQSDVRDLAGLEGYFIVCNPPYGMRLGSEKEAAAIYGQLGDFLKNRCRSSMAFVYFGNVDLVASLGLQPAWKRPLKNGGLKGLLVKYIIP